jgi:type I restriction enzyme S subunit
MAVAEAVLGTGRTGGREATTGVISGRFALAVGNPGRETPPGWKWTALSRVAQLESGHTPSRKHPEYWDGEVPWIGIKDAVDNHGRTISDTYQHVTELGLANSSARLLPANTVCLSRTASVGFVVVMGRSMATSQDFVNWVCGPEIDPQFLKYVLLAENEALFRFASGTTHQTIYYPEAKAFHVCLPPVGEQKAIAAMLGALDDKIEWNRRTNATLEAIARGLFQSWFVDFDPVRAKLDGRQPVSLDPASVTLFANEFEDSELGPIPRGWQVGNVENILSFSRSAINPSEFSDELFAHYSLPAFDKGRVAKLETGSAIKSQKLLVSPNAILASKLNPHIPRIWLPDVATNQRTICSTEFLVAQPKGGFSREFLFCLFTSSQFASEYATLVTGTTGSHQRVKGESVLRMRIVVPPITVLTGFSKLAKPMLDQVTVNIRESATLAAVRDTLLPRLLSGEVTAKTNQD